MHPARRCELTMRRAESCKFQKITPFILNLPNFVQQLIFQDAVYADNTVHVEEQKLGRARSKKRTHQNPRVVRTSGISGVGQDFDQMSLWPCRSPPACHSAPWCYDSAQPTGSECSCAVCGSHCQSLGRQSSVFSQTAAVCATGWIPRTFWRNFL